MKFRVVVEDGPFLAAMRETRRDLNQDIKVALLGVAEDVALPVARRLAPHRTGRLRRSLVAKATTRNAYLTTNLTKRQGGRRVGLLEFGGTVRKTIRPTGTRKALRMPDGRFVAKVTTPRVYAPRLFMTRSVETQRVRINQRVEGDVAAAIQKHIDRHATFPV